MRAGRRAAYRAVDVALPLLQPGKSLRFATLPEGNDPDDLVRSGGRDAIEDVLAGARPLAQMLWMRETEAGGFDTPERRAALEARLGAIMSGIGEESVRRYYRREFEGRLRSLFEGDEPGGGAAPGRGGRLPQGRNPRRPAGRRADHSADRWAGKRAEGAARSGRGRPGSRRAAGPIWSPARSWPRARSTAATALAIPRREALILQTALNHPWLLHDHLEDIAEVEFRFAETEKVKVALIDIVAHGGAPGPGKPGGRARPARARRAGRAHREGHHHRFGLGRAAGGGARRRADDLEAAHRLASAMALLN